MPCGLAPAEGSASSPVSGTSSLAACGRGPEEVAPEPSARPSAAASTGGALYLESGSKHCHGAPPSWAILFAVWPERGC